MLSKSECPGMCFAESGEDGGSSSQGKTGPGLGDETIKPPKELDSPPELGTSSKR